MTAPTPIPISTHVLIMPRKQHTKQFKLDAINYRKEHPDLTQLQCAKNLGIGISTLARWESQYRNNDGDIPVISSGNYESEVQREWLNRFNIKNYRHAYNLIFEYIETFYNTVRIHSHCDYMSPDEFEKLYERVKSLPAT